MRKVNHFFVCQGMDKTDDVSVYATVPVEVLSENIAYMGMTWEEVDELYDSLTAILMDRRMSQIGGYDVGEL